MQTDVAVLLYPVVKGSWLPCFGEEDHGHGLSKVVQLKAASADAGHDGGVWYGSHGNGQFASSDDEICVCCGTAATLLAEAANEEHIKA